MGTTISSNWEDYTSPFIKKLVHTIECEENPDPSDLELVHFLKESTLNPSNPEMLATPLFELSSITIICDDLNLFFVSNDFLVLIEVIDSDQRHYVIFESDYIDANDVLSLDNNRLDISLEKVLRNHPIWIPKSLTLKLLIQNKSIGLQRIDYFDMKLERNVVYDKQHCLELESEVYKRVSVRFTYFRCATLASVDCRLEEIGDISGTGHGHVYAGVSGAINVKFRVGDQFRTRVLLNQQDDVLISDATKLRWSRQLAVPAYSDLQLIVDNLVINGEKIDTDGYNLKFIPYIEYTEVVEIEGQKWRFLVTMKWEHVYKSLPLLCECYSEGDVSGPEAEIEFSEFEDSDSEASSQKRPRLQSMELPLTDVNMLMEERVKPLPSFRFSNNNLVEVFSISVCPYVDNQGSPFILYGKISSCDFWDEHEVFNGDKSGGCLVDPHQPISMVEQSRCYLGNFSMRLDLKDNQGRQMSRGYLSWCFVSAEPWLDRRMCSIVRGKDGFAAVHYTLFYNASQARVAISFYSESRDAHRVYGRIRARYTGYRYTTQYDRKYYQMVLFQKGKDEYVRLHDGSVLPLSRLVVAVPLDEALVISADLKFVGGTGEKLKGKVKFEAQAAYDSVVTTKPKIIEGRKCSLVVSVSWG